MEKTFVAQAYDAGDPAANASPMYRVGKFNPLYQGQSRADQVDAPYQIRYDNPYPGREGYSAGGFQSFTGQFMGGIHPRAKQTVGRRLALGARAIAYNHAETGYTGAQGVGSTVVFKTRVSLCRRRTGPVLVAPAVAYPSQQLTV